MTIALARIESFITSGTSVHVDVVFEIDAHLACGRSIYNVISCIPRTIRPVKISTGIAMQYFHKITLQTPNVNIYIAAMVSNFVS